jgi:hypothetical protein
MKREEPHAKQIELPSQKEDKTKKRYPSKKE